MTEEQEEKNPEPEESPSVNSNEDQGDGEQEKESPEEDEEEEMEEEEGGPKIDVLNTRKGRSDGGAGTRMWRCIDDGTGTSMFYINRKGTKSTIKPPHFVHEVVNDGKQTRKYYHKMRCIRCRTKVAPSLISMNDQTECFATNFCENCMVACTVGIERARGNGTAIWGVREEQSMPLHFFMNLKKHFFSVYRSDDIQKRALEARVFSLQCSKDRRDSSRGGHVGAVCEQEHNLYPDECIYISWGFDPKKFDEYYGHHDDMGRPHGRGIKTFNDGSQYIGDWKHGLMETADVGMWTRPDGSRYEGQWVAGFKHGKGKQVYPDSGDTYEGEFANGYEHGHGVTTSTSKGTVFEGRFRFGRRDGPGHLKGPNGLSERKVFKGGPGWHEPPIPPVDDQGGTYNNPETLKELALNACAQAMRTQRNTITSRKITEKCPEHIKSLLAETYVNLCKNEFNPKGLLEAAGKYAFSGIHDVAHFSGFPINTAMIDSIVYFVEGNMRLKTLACVGSKLDFESISLICRQMHAWKSLRELDLSFNTLNVEALETVLESVSRFESLVSIKLAGCRLKPRAALVVGAFLGSVDHILEADFSFNLFDAIGADPIARGLAANTSLKSLKLRQNGFGPMGGMLFVEALRIHPCIKVLDLTDNRIGADVMMVLSGRLKGGLKEVMESSRAQHIHMPTYYKEGRFGETPMFHEEAEDDEDLY